MGIDRVFATPIVQVDQERYEELIKNELKMEQYRARADEAIKKIIEASDNEIKKESEDNK